jgi:hypothetical protein
VSASDRIERRGGVGRVCASTTRARGEARSGVGVEPEPEKKSSSFWLARFPPGEREMGWATVASGSEKESAKARWSWAGMCLDDVGTGEARSWVGWGRGSEPDKKASSFRPARCPPGDREMGRTTVASESALDRMQE